jgi:hypothetical protein
MLCHCSICQAFNAAPMSDMLVYRAREVAMPANGTVDYRTYRPPPNVRRGKCVSCGQPAIEVFRLPPLPSIVMVPTPMVPDPSAVPEPALHVFYDNRRQDCRDALPRYSGYLRSQLAFFRFFVCARRGSSR